MPATLSDVDANDRGVHIAATNDPPGRRMANAPARPRVRSTLRRSVERMVVRELSRVRSGRGPSPLTPRTLLADAGIDLGRLLDATCRIEGHYQMRFHDEWLRDVRTVGDLIGCVVARMFDGLDVAMERSRAGFAARVAAR